jgi:hypothetical protein
MPKDQPTATTARQDLVAFLNSIGNVHADRVNPAFRSRYASLSEVLDTVKGVAVKHNLAVHQTLQSYDGQVRVSTVFLHNDGTEYLAGSLAVKSDGLTPQQLGSALTYLRRQSLQTAVGVSTDLDDDGASASGARPAPAAAPAKPAGPWYSFLSALEAERAHAYCVSKGWLPPSAADLSELPADRVELILSNKPAFMKAIGR